ncbi:TetR/AcrR family transcriptional regulator [Pseudonocardiaceae bacterium YIM PH 21723]|nr:TetR/AcrR family transcriptional regulator [Pseudonocardiaceae bacterium YIM PH 21723]
MFRRDGYHATSLDKVAEAAGYSKGAVYSNFRNKDELCMAVLEEIRATEFGAIATSLSGQGSFEERLNAFEEWADKTIGDAGWTRLEVEFGIAAQHNPELLAAVAGRAQSLRDAVTALVEMQGFPIPPPLTAETAAIALWSIGVGLGVQRAVDPTLSIRPLTDAIRAFTQLAKA